MMKAILTAALLLATGPAMAQQQCGPRDRVIGLLGAQYGETPASIALDQMGRMVEVLVGPEGTWTIIMTRPQGPTCIIGSGGAWEWVSGKPKDPEA